MSDGERRLTIYAPQVGGSLYRVEYNGLPVEHVCAIAFACDANSAQGFEATMTFRVDVVDIVAAGETLRAQASAPPEQEGGGPVLSWLGGEVVRAAGSEPEEAQVSS